MPGTLYIISAPSGCGKTSLTKALLKKIDNLLLSVSYTTRPSRKNETNGKDYYFVNDQEFQDLIEQNAFLEYASVFGYYYGTATTWVTSQLKKGIDVIVEIDWQGAKQIKHNFSNVTSIFLLPPTLSSLEERLKNRNQDSEMMIARRMAQAKTEMLHYAEYDYVIFNQRLEQAVNHAQCIIEANRLRTSIQTCSMNQQITHLLDR